MIKNNRQYLATRKALVSFNDSLRALELEATAQRVDPVMSRAFKEGIKSQVATLTRELEEYEHLLSGDVDVINVSTLDGLPRGLIQARIARRLSQKELASKLGVKPQQVQRWEFEDYENVGFARLLEVARALDVVVSEKIELPAAGFGSVSKKLATLGIDKQFFWKKIAPEGLPVGTVEANGAIFAAASRLSNIFGINVTSGAVITRSTSLRRPVELARFKVPANADPVRIEAYTQYMSYLGALVTKSYNPEVAPLRQMGWRESRILLFPNQIISYEVALRSVWRLGVAVLPLNDSVRIHGCCLAFDERKVIFLKQRSHSSARWLFDLLHEFYHAMEQGDESELASMQSGPVEPERRLSLSERAANEFAGNIIFDGRGEELYCKALSHARHTIAYLKRSVAAVAKAESVDVAALANFVAFSLKIEKGIDWWGAAANLQCDESEPYQLSKEVFFENVDLGLIGQEDRALLMQSFNEEQI